MNSSLHRIRSLRWQVGAGSTEEAFSWRAMLCEKGTDLLLPVLEQAFDEAVSTEQLLHIPKMELSVKLSDEGELDTALKGELLDQLRQQLGCLQKGDRTSGQMQDKEVVSVGHSRFETLLHYLKTGTTTWQSAGTAAAEHASALREICLVEWPRILKQLKVVRQDAPFYFRLMQLLSEEECTLLVRTLYHNVQQENGAAAKQCLELLLEEERERFSAYTRLSLIAGILAETAAEQNSFSTRFLFNIAKNAVPPQERHKFHSFLSALPRQVAELFLQHCDTHVSCPETAPEAATNKQTESPKLQCNSKDRSVARHHHPEIIPEKDNRPQLLSETKHPLKSKPNVTVERLFPMLVQQSGLVLLHPHIPRLFENCGIKDSDSRELPLSTLPHAAALLHFLATGREELYEYELGLIKVLLGLHPETPLPVCAGLLTSEDIEESEALLQSVIKHWSILKNTSTQGLRSSFIERQGLLREENKGWKLNVERSPYDMLLDQIPWSISIVKLPWMHRAIFTEWSP